MKPAALVALAALSLPIGFVSARLLRLAAHTRRTPELLLGLSTALPLVGFTFGFVGAAVGGGIPAPWVTEVAGCICDFGFIATVGFVWQVFRQDERWAKALCVVLALAFMTMPFVNHWVSWIDGVPSALVPRSVVRTTCYAWAAIESLHYGRLMRRRVFFGLAEPLVANRFSLWGFAHVCLALMLLLVMAGVKLHLSGADFARLCTLSGFSMAVVAAISLLFSFFPSERYVRHVERRYRREVIS